MIRGKNIKLMKNNNGITLIALVVTIIVLIILAGVSIKIVLGNNGIVEKAKQAKIMQEIASIQEKLELLKAPIQLEEYSVNLENYLKKLEEVKDKYEVNYIEKKNDINAEILVNEKYIFLIKDKENGDVEIIYLGKAGELILSATSGTYTYPTTGTFEVVKNATGGELSVKSQNENIAKATISRNVVTVIPQNMTGVTKIIVTSAANGEYAEGKAVYTAIVENGTISIEADAYTGIYDGKDHDAVSNVRVIPIDATVEYSLNGGEFSTNIPKVNAAMTYSIIIKASKIGYETKEINKIVTIDSISVTSLKPGDYVEYEVPSTVTYIDNWQILYNDDTYGLQIISSKNVKTVSVSGVTGYNNLVKTLNTNAGKYINTTYADSARCVGSNPNSTETSTGTTSTTTRGSYAMKNADSSYKNDVTAMQGATSQNENGIMQTGEAYWLASRYYDTTVENSITHYNYYGRYVNTYGNNANAWVCFYYSDWEEGGRTYGLRPVIKLKSGLVISGGNGTIENPYVITNPNT